MDLCIPQQTVVGPSFGIWKISRIQSAAVFTLCSLHYSIAERTCSLTFDICFSPFIRFLNPSITSSYPHNLHLLLYYLIFALTSVVGFFSYAFQVSYKNEFLDGHRSC